MTTAEERRAEAGVLKMGVCAVLELLKHEMGPTDRATTATVLTRCFDAYLALFEGERGEPVAWEAVSTILQKVIEKDPTYWLDGTYIRWGAVERDLVPSPRMSRAPTAAHTETRGVGKSQRLIDCPGGDACGERRTRGERRVREGHYYHRRGPLGERITMRIGTDRRRANPQDRSER